MEEQIWHSNINSEYFSEIESLFSKATILWIPDTDLKEVKFFLWELFQLIKWIDTLLDSWNLICGILLLRTLAERVILFRIIFESKENSNKNLQKYIDHWKIIAYLWMNKNPENYKSNMDYFNDCKDTYLKKNENYLLWNKHNLYKWLLPNRKVISFDALYRDYIWVPLYKYGINQDINFYEIFCHIHHGNSLTQSFLNGENPFEEEYNSEITRTTHIFILQFLLLVFEIFWEQEVICRILENDVMQEKWVFAIQKL